MTVISLQLQTDPEVEVAVYKIGLSDGSLFSIKTSYLSSIYQDKIQGVCNKVLPVEEEEAFRFAGACFQAEQTALRLITRAEQTSFGLSAKLERRGHSPSSVRAVISHLTERKMINDRRYAELWLQSRLSRKAESPRRLITALCSRGIDRTVAAETLTSVLHFEGESGLLKKYMEKNHLSIENTLKSKLKYEGFSAAVIESFREKAGL
ncbi:MAG: recombination regulator RecX [Treponema sp.]|jgi:regulatory protein|nr:recombination regulator RecX [Treponema sp.]